MGKLACESCGKPAIHPEGKPSQKKALFRKPRGGRRFLAHYDFLVSGGPDGSEPPAARPGQLRLDRSHFRCIVRISSTKHNRQTLAL